MVNTISDKLKNLISVLPEKPGIYQYFNKDNIIIYVGKAKNLKKRVSSYFVKNHDSAKTRILVRNIVDIKHVVVDTEQDALLLENNLIKKYQPKYNVQLKDDKSFPWICIKNEPFPRVVFTRNVIKDGSTYFGPYTSARMVRSILDFTKQLYKFRTCNYSLTPENIDAKKYKVCLEYHIGNCFAPCIGKFDLDTYNSNIDQIKKILKGNISQVIQYFKELMQSYAENFEFEKAQDIKLRLELLEKFQSKSMIVNPSIHDVDVFSIIEDDKFGYANFLKISNGSIIQSHTVEIKKKLNETLLELLPTVITDIRQRLNSSSKEIIVPFDPQYTIEGVNFTIPKIGDKKKLLDLSERNVKYYRFEKLKQIEKIDPHKRTNRILETLKKDLHLSELPTHVECFDNSNVQGNYPVAACVVFKNAKPSKNDYRHFNIKTVEGANDFASMEEVVYRRYKRLIEEKKPLPQLIVIDGGKGQLSSAVKSLQKLDLNHTIAIIGIAKKLEEIYFPNDPVPLYLDKNSESLKVIQHLRNEAHRFGITFHRSKRSKGAIQSELDDIKGIGEKTKELLLSDFKSIKSIQNAKLSDLIQSIGKSKANIIYNYYHLTNTNSPPKTL